MFASVGPQVAGTRGRSICAKSLGRNRARWYGGGMTSVDSYKHGIFCWADLGAPEPTVAVRFYGGLFDLGVHHVPIGGGESYTMLRKGGRDVAAIHPMRADQLARGVAPHWLLYVNVDDITRAATRVVQAGGELVSPPFEVADSGRMAVLTDPCGAHLALWQAGKHAGAGAIDEPSTMCWWELNTRDAGRAGRFYSEVFGWRRDERDVAATGYTNFFAGERRVGGMLQMTAEWGAMPSHWMMYFMVGDCDHTAALAGRLGGAVPVPPTDIPPVGRFAVVSDPHGALLSIVQMAPATQARRAQGSQS
jgi:predicted enzyme related to lactoylglutathione lyase